MAQAKHMSKWRRCGFAPPPAQKPISKTEHNRGRGAAGRQQRPMSRAQKRKEREKKEGKKKRLGEKPGIRGRRAPISERVQSITIICFAC
ncbi:hypothetical protein LY76DRAFT_14419 [Colletotrichum caudatum]|nr:hypothetical protein LY76DRAFT_14419 [Colletotrichum caudatum]